MVASSAIASSSLVTEWVKGRSIDDAETIKNTEIGYRVIFTTSKDTLFYLS